MARPRLGANTVPTTAAFGNAAAAGTAGANAALADHRHGMPADPVTAHAAAADPHTGYRLESVPIAGTDLAANLNPIYDVADISAITLPNPSYPPGTLVWDVASQGLYSVEQQPGGGGGPVDVWVSMEGVPGPAGSVPVYPEPPELPVVVPTLPTLPDALYPVGTEVYNQSDGLNYVNTAGAWVLLDYTVADPLYFDESTGLLMKYELGSYVNVVNTADLSGQITGDQIEPDSVLGVHIVDGEVGVGELAVDLVLSSEDVWRIIRTAVAGQRVEYDPGGLRAYDGSGSLVLNVPTDGGVVTISAEVWARSLTVDPAGVGSSMGGPTSFPGGAIATLAAGIANPTVAPTVVDSLESLTLTTWGAGHGICYDPSGSGGPTYLMGGDPSIGGGHVFTEVNATTGAVVRTILPSNTNDVTTETVGATSHVSDTADGTSGSALSQIATPITLPSRAGVVKVTAISAYFAGYGGSCEARVALWDTSGNILETSDTFTAASKSFSNGASVKYNKSLQTKKVVSSGGTYWAGFFRLSSGDGFQWDKDDGAGKTTKKGNGLTGDMTSITTDSDSKPNVYLTIEVTQTVTVEGTMGKIVGIARAGAYIFVLDANGKLFRYNQSDGSYSAQYDVAASVTGVKANGGLFFDGTDLVIVTTTAASGASTLKLVKVSTAGVVGATITGAAVANAATVVLRGGYNDGTNYWLYNSEVPGVTAYNKTTGAVVADRNFGSGGECSSGVTFDGTVFRGWVSGQSKVWKFTTWDWATPTVPYWFAYSWADVGTAETAVSPRVSMTVGRRRRVLVTNPTMPGTPVDSVYVYALPNATSPAGTAMKQQATGAASSRYLSGYSSGGAAGLSTSTFGAGTSAEIRSESSTGWSLKGDGTVVIHPSQPIGGKPPVVNVYTANGTWTRPAGLSYVVVEVVGGGGGGGGVANPAASQMAIGTGGGSGGYAKKLFTAQDLTNLGIGVGNGCAIVRGAGGTAGTGNAGTGGLSSFTAGAHVVLANPGTGGATSVSGTSAATELAGTGGTASGGDVTVLGGDGWNSTRVSGTQGGQLGQGAAGVGPYGGGSAKPSAANAGGAGAGGNQYGGGGAGGWSKNASGSAAGGVGAAGIVVVTEYY